MKNKKGCSRRLFISLLFAGIAGIASCPVICKAQIQVSQEPRHHKVFENDWVRVLDVHIPPGDTSLMHKHSTPSVFIVLSNTKTGSQVLAEPAKTNFSDGHIWFESFYEQPRIHRVWNSDTVEFHVIDMEVLKKENQPVDPSIGADASNGLKSLTLLFDEKPVRGYRATLSAGSTFRLLPRKAAVMIVGLDNTSGLTRDAATANRITINKKPFAKKGDFLFVQPGQDIVFVNKDKTDANFAIFELK